jgi:phage-related minor tail protein
MTVKLSELRVSSSFESGAYKAGMDQKVAADRAGAASSTQLGLVVTDTTQKIGTAARTSESLSKSYITGYAQAAKFETAIHALGRGIEAGTVPMQRVSSILDGIYQKFGRTADATAIAARGYIGLSKEVDILNAKLAANAGSDAGILRAAASVDASRRIAAGMASVGSASLAASRESERLIQGMTLTGAAMRGAGREAALSSYAMTNLAFQLNDVATMAAMGADPLRIMASQAGQLYQILQTGEGGVRGSLGYLAGVISGMITPLRLASGGFAVLGAAMAGALVGAVRNANEINVALSGIGIASGQTAESINAIALAAASAGEATAGQARDMLRQFTETGRIGPQVSAELVRMSRQFAATFGEDLPTAASRMAKAFADPAKGVDDLNARLGVFDDVTRRTIASLTNQGRRFEAQQLMLPEINKGLVTHAEATSRIGRAWQDAGEWMSRYWDGVKSRVSGMVEDPTLDQKLATARQQLDDMMNPKPGLPFARRWGLPTQSEIRDQLRAIEDLERQKRKIELDAEDERRRANVVEQSNWAGDTTRRILPEISQASQFADEAERLNRAITDPEIFKSLDQWTRAGLSRAAEMREAQSVWIGEAMKNGGVAVTMAREEHDLTIASISARSTAQRADIAYREEITRLAREGDPDAAERAAMRSSEVYAQAAETARRSNEQRVISADQGLEQARAELALIGQTASTREREIALIQVRQQLEGEALRNEGDRNAYSRDHLKIMEERVRWQQELNRQITQETTLRELAFEREQMGRSEREQRVYGRLDSLGLLTDGQINGAPAELMASQIRFNEVMRISQDSSKTFFADLVRGARDGASATEALASAMSRLGDKLIDMAVDQAASSMFAPFSRSVAAGATGYDPTWSASVSGGGGLFGGSILPGILHDGGVAGSGNYPRRRVSASLFNGAPRYHSGGIAGLLPNEVPAILERGERVIPKGQSGSGGLTISMPVNISAPGADAAQLALVRKEINELKQSMTNTIITVVRDGRQRGLV